MSQRDLLRLVLANLNRMRARVALTAIGVIIGTAAIIVLISLGVGLQTSTQSLFEMGDLTLIDVNAFGSFGGFRAASVEDSSSRDKQNVLGDEALRDIRALPHVVVVTPQQGLQGFGELKLGRKTGSSFIQGILPEAVEAMDWELESGTPRLARGQIILGPKAFDEGGGMFMMGPGMAMRAEGPGGSAGGSSDTSPDLQGRSLTLTLTKYDDENNEITRNERLRVAGVFAEGNHNYDAYMPLSQVEELNRWFTGRRRTSADGYDRVTVKVDDPDNVLAAQREIEALGFGTSSQQQFLRELNRSFLVIQGVLGGVGAIALLVAAFGIANTMTMAIYERTKEIGVMKAIGATNNDVLRVFLSEAGAIGLIGGVLGAAIGWGVGKLINLVVQTWLMSSANGPPDSPPSDVVVTPLWLIAFALVFATLVGVISGIYPALRAANMKPLRALRTE